MRLIQAARLSRMKEATTSFAKQDAEARRYADAYGHDIIATAEDSDVSGDTSPWQRAGLGPWLSDPDKIASYDGIIAAHLDRLGRNVRHLDDLHRWCADNHKALITVEPAIDWQSDVGTLIWGIMSWLAEQELKAIKRRTKGTAKWLRDNKYLRAKAPFGFRIIASGDHKTIEPDPDTAPVLREAVDRYLAGDTFLTLAEWLDDSGVKPPQGGIWQPGSISQMFRNRVLVGELGAVRCEPILDVATWRGLQDKLASTAKRGAPTGEGMLTGVIRCAKCGGSMYRLASTAKGKKYTYYRCQGSHREPSRCRNMVPLDYAEAEVSAEVLSYGNAPEVRREGSEPNDHSAELVDLDARIAELDQDDSDYDDRHAELRAERAAIKALPPEPGTVRLVRTGRTVAEAWNGLDIAGKRQFLVDHETTVKAKRGDVKVTFGREPYATHREAAQGVM